MARIRAYKQSSGFRVKVTGRLTASDMRRLEHACSTALTTEPVMLDLDLSGVTDSDNVAALIVQRMAQRGARVRYRVVGEESPT
jgi:hypothetical protein